jgi:hypothetical protein
MISTLSLQFLIVLLAIANSACDRTRTRSEGNHGSMYGKYFQGDIKLTHEQAQFFMSISRTGLVDTFYRWPKVNGPVIVPYAFEDGHYGEQRFIKVLQAFN